MAHSSSSAAGGTARRAAVLVFAVLQILVPILPSLGIGTEIGERSDSVNTLITPAGWAFAIWGPLYAGSLVYAIYQALPGQRGNPLLARIGWPSAGAFLGNALWALYTQSYGLSAISALIIVFTLACLLSIYRAFAAHRPGFTLGEQLCAVVPLSALAAWLTAATIVNIAASLKFHGFDPPVDAALLSAAAVLVGGLIASAALGRTGGNPWYALVFLWALAAIYAAGGQESALIAGAVALSALLVLATTLLHLSRRGNRAHWLDTAERI